MSILKFVTGGKGRFGSPLRTALGIASLRQRVIVIVGLFAASFFELFGLMMIIPLIAAAAGARETKAGLMSVIHGALGAVGIPFDPSILVVLIVLALSLKALLSVAVTGYVSEIVAQLGCDMQTKLVRALLQAEWSFFIRQPLGRLTHAAGPEAVAAGEVFLGAANIVSHFLQGALFLGACAWLSWKLTIAGAVVGVLMLASQRRLIRSRRRAARAHRAQMRRLAAHFTDAMIGIKPLRAMGRTQRLSALFEADAKAAWQTLKTKLVSAENITEIQEPFIGMAIALTFFLAMSVASVGSFDLILAGICFVRVVGSFVACQKQLLNFAHAYELYKGLLKLLEEIERYEEQCFGSRAPPVEGGVTLDGVTFGYGEKVVLKEVSATFRSGEVTALIGPSGIGKSTLVDLITGLYRPQGGRIFVGDVDLNEIEIKAWRRVIGYVPQEINLFHETVVSNVALWEDGITRDDVREALERSGAWSFVSQLPGQLDYVIGERGNLLSGGQRQRISLARALVHRPKILILDEATTGLDRATEKGICETISRLCRADTLTVIAISHQHGWLGVADTVYQLQDASIVERSSGAPGNTGRSRNAFTQPQSPVDLPIQL